MDKKQERTEKRGMRFHNEKRAFSLSRQKESNLSIGEAAGKPLPCSCLFCRYSLDGSSFNGSVIHKVQVTTLGAVCGKHKARNLIGDTRELGYTQSRVISHSSKPW